MAKPDVSFCPLALPLIAGPGAIALVIDSGKHAMQDGLEVWLAAGVAVIAAMVVSWICLREAPLVLKVLGHAGMQALTKIIGFLLVCIAAQMIITGAVGAFGLGPDAPSHDAPHVTHDEANHGS